MAGRKGKLVGRKDLGPAVRFEVARALPLAGIFNNAEERDSGNLGSSACGKCYKPQVSTEDQKGNAYCVPDPAISQPSGPDHPDTKPPGRSPAMDLPHDLMIAILDELPNRLCGRHGCTSKSWWAAVRISLRTSEQTRAARIRYAGSF
jgi:hypothetical protein